MLTICRFMIETPNDKVLHEDLRPRLTFHESYTPYYKHYFFEKGKLHFRTIVFELTPPQDHKNFWSEHPELGPIIVHVENFDLSAINSRESVAEMHVKLRVLLRLKDVHSLAFICLFVDRNMQLD